MIICTMQKIEYTRIAKEDIARVLSETIDFFSGHIYLITNGYVIVGHNRKHDNIAALGGLGDPNETLLMAILREYLEESLGCLFSKDALNKLGFDTEIDFIKHVLLNCNMLITRKSSKGHHYSAFCDISHIPFDIKEVEQRFIIASANPDLKDAQKENDMIVMVALDDIKETLQNGRWNVKDSNGIERTIRDVNGPPYDYLLKNVSTL